MKTGGQFLVRRVGAEPIMTPERLTEEQKELASMVRDFVSDRIRSNKEKIEQYDMELVKTLMREAGELGLLGIDIPEEYGGLGLDKITSALINETVAFSGSGSFVVAYSAHVGIGTLPIVWWGTKEQKEKYLPLIGSGQEVAAYALTEPGSGSDALNAKSTAVLSEDGKYYILNGTKQFITNGAIAGVITLFAKVDGEKFTAFIVEAPCEGLTVGPEEKKMGLHGCSTTSLIMENMKVPVENVLGKIGKGAEIAFNILNVGRFKLGAADLGACKICISESVKYAKERRQFGQSISNFDVIKGKIADMVCRTYSLESIIYRTVGLMDEHISQLDESAPDYTRQVAHSLERFAIEASMCKVYGSESLWFVSDTGIQIFGGYGFSEEYPLAAVARDTRVDRIFEGTNEINRQIISGYFLKKALMEELPIREAVKQVFPLIGEKLPEAEETHFPLEKRSLELSKGLALYLFNQTIAAFGQGLKNQQQLGEILADCFTELYVVDSVLTRISQRFEKEGVNPVHQHIGEIIAAEAMYKVSSLAMKGITTTLHGELLKKALPDMEWFIRSLILPKDLFELKRRVADDILVSENYNY